MTILGSAYGCVDCQVKEADEETERRAGAVKKKFFKR